jgi:hypothetical protein
MLGSNFFLAKGGKEQTMWEMDLDDYGTPVYRHQKLSIESDYLPPGALLDDSATFR